MLKTSEGIIVRTLKYGESSVILDIFSSDLGLKSYIIGGVRNNRPKSKGAMIRVLNLVRFVAYVKEGDSLSRIKEIEYNYIYKSLPFDVIKGTLATFLIEICRKAIRSSDSDEDLYHYIVKGLIHLDNMNQGLAHFHIIFLIGLAKKLGFELSNNYDDQHMHFDLAEGIFRTDMANHRYAVDATSSHALSLYLSDIPNPQVSKSTRLKVLKSLVKYYQYHINEFGELKSLPIILSLYE